MPTFDVQKARRDGLDDATIQRMIQLTGSTPSEPLQATPTPQPPAQTQSQPRYATPGERFRLSFGDAQGREQFMQQRGIQEGMVNKPGLDFGDITSKAGGLLPILGAAAGGTAALPVAAAFGATGVGVPAAIGIESAGMGVGAAAGEGFRQGIGQLLGVQKNTSPTEGAKDVAVETAYGLAGPLVNKATTTLGRPVIRAVKDKAANLFIKSLDPTSRQLRSGAVSIDDAKDWISRGAKGTIKGMTEWAEKLIQTNRPIVNEYIEKSGQGSKVIGSADELLEPLAKLESQTKGLPKRMRKAVQAYADDVIDAVGNVKDITLKQGDEMRYNLDKALTKFYQSTDEAGEVAIEKQGMLSVSNRLREMVNKNLPENFNGQNVREAREAIHSASKLARALWLRETKTSTGDKAAMVGLSALGSLLGFGVAGGAGAVAGGALAGVATRLAQQAPVRTGLASMLQPVVSGAGKALNAIPAEIKQKALTVGTQGIMRLLDSSR